MRSPAEGKVYDKDTVISVAVLALLFLTAILVQSTVYLNHDVSWIIRTSSWMLDGKAFGRDFLDPSPPLIWYISLPPAAVSRLTGFSEPTVFRLYTFLLAALVYALCWRLLRPFRAEGSQVSAAVLLIAFAFATLVRSNADFGQREHFATLLAMPYLLLVAGMGRGYSFPARISIAVGLLGGIGFAIKPYFLFVPLGIETYRWISTRSIRSIFRLDTWVLASVVFSYLCCVFLFTPDYITEIVPLFRSVYWAFENPLSEVLSRLWYMHKVGLLTIGVVLLFRRNLTSYEIVLGIGAVGFLASYLIQMKGWTYHVLPFVTMLFTLVFFAGARVVTNLQRTKFRTGLILAYLTTVFFHQGAIVANWYALANRTSGREAYHLEQIVETIDRYAAGRNVYAFSTQVYPTFPPVIYSSAEWGGRMNSQFVLPALVQQRAGIVSQNRGLEEAEHYLRDAVLDDLRKYRPALVLVDSSDRMKFVESTPFDSIDFYSEDPRFVNIWRQYDEIDAVGFYRLFIRRAH